VEWAETTLAAAGPLNLLPVIVDTLITKGSALGDAGHRAHEGLAILMGALVMAETHGLVRLEFRARTNIAAWHIVDDQGVRLATARAGFELARKLGQREWAISLGAHCIDAALFVGEWDWALSVFAELDQEDVPLESRANLILQGALTKAYRGDLTAESSRMAKIEAAMGSFTNPQWASILPLNQSLIAFVAGDLEASYRLAMRGVTTARGDLIGMALGYATAAQATLWLRDGERAGEAVRALDAIPLRGAWLDATREQFHAGLLALDGHVDEALAAYAQPAGRFREMDWQFCLGMCQMEAAMLIGPDHPGARAAAEEAREIFARLGSPPMLQRLDSLVEEALIP
jgi:hypothetical protein